MSVAQNVLIGRDGGVRRGKDVFRALALGASGVFVGRPVLHGLAAGGAGGAARVLEIRQRAATRTRRTTSPSTSCRGATRSS